MSSEFNPTDWFSFDGFEYRCIPELDSTYRIIDERGETVTEGILLLGDDRYADACSAIVYALESEGAK